MHYLFMGVVSWEQGHTPSPPPLLICPSCQTILQSMNSVRKETYRVSRQKSGVTFDTAPYRGALFIFFVHGVNALPYLKPVHDQLAVTGTCKGEKIIMKNIFISRRYTLAYIGYKIKLLQKKNSHCYKPDCYTAYSNPFKPFGTLQKLALK